MTTLFLVLALVLAEATQHRTCWISHYLMPPRKDGP